MINTLEVYYKLDNTFCLNSDKMKFNLIKEDEGDDRDCKDVNEMIDCLGTINTVCLLVESLKKHVIFYENGGIAFKNISSKKNKKIYELMKEVLLCQTVNLKRN